MKKLLLFLTCVCLTLTCCGALTAFAAERTQIFLGDAVPAVSDGSAFQPTYAVGEGGSSVKYALETPSNNKFVRMANFDGTYLSDYTAVAVVCSAAQAKVASIVVNYRLYEGNAAYSDSDVVLRIGFRNVYKQFTYGDLTANVNGDFSWKSLKFDIAPEQSLTADYVLAEFYFKASSYAESRTCLDIDDFSVKYDGTERCADGKFDGAVVTADGKADTDYAVDEATVAASKALMLSPDKIAYRVNTEYDNSLNTSFDTFTAARTLPAGKSESLFTDAASGSQYLVYDQSANNTFMRVGNFDATKSKPLVRMPFADNDTGVTGNIPKTTQVYVNFSYRLYVDKEVLQNMNDSDMVLELSTRRSTLNNSGKFTLDNLIVNQKDDATWQNLSCVLKTSLSSTAYLEIIFCSQAVADYGTGTYIDIDNVYIGDTPSSKNYACNNGTWEGTVQTSSQGTPMNPYLILDGNYGTPATVNRVSELNYDMLLPSGGSFGVSYGKNVTSGVYDMSFDLVAKQGDKLELLFDGRGGFRTEVTVGTDVETDSLVVCWQKVADEYKCFVTYAKYDGQPLSRVDFVNKSANSLQLDNLFVGQVSSVCTEAGDYYSFVTEVSRLRAVAGNGNYNKQSQKAFDNAASHAEALNEFASQARMNAALDEINDAMNAAKAKADLVALNRALSDAEDVFTNGKSYTKASMSLFKDSYFVAKNMTEQNSQAEVDAAVADLTSKTNALVECNDALTVATIGGVTVVATAAVVFKRKKKEADNER